MSIEVAATFGMSSTAVAMPRHLPFTVIEGGASAKSERPDAVDTLRRDLSLLVMSLFLSALLAFVWQTSEALVSARIDQALADTVAATVTVMPGDSLWTIADSHPVEGCTTAELVQHIKDENHLTSSSLHAGMRLSVPAPARALD